MIAKKPKTDVEILQEKLQGIRDQKGILGYILRGTKTASIDLKDPSKIMDYAMFSATALDVGRNMTKTLDIGEVDTIVVESEETKLLSMNVNSHQLSLFMEKNVDHNKLYNNLK
jgi:predicted regulator of Ras-like GTPase activity (Roadblock/LC7/MglB family)